MGTKKEVFDWSIGEVGHHPYHGRCIVKDITESAIAGWLDPVLVVICEYDGEVEYFGNSDVNALVPIEEWDASEQLKKLSERN